MKAAPVPPTAAPTDLAVRQRWHVQIKGERKVRTVTIFEVTEKTVMVLDTTARLKKTERYLKDDVHFIERD